jgi:Tfp pilus assembly protein FimV
VLVRADGRLSREGRLLRTVVGIAVLVGALVFAPRAFASGTFVSGTAGSATAGAQATRPYVVVEGDSLWEIAGAVDPGAPRDVAVAAIMRLNGMANSTLRLGEQILVPAA